MPMPMPGDVFLTFRHVNCFSFHFFVSLVYNVYDRKHFLQLDLVLGLSIGSNNIFLCTKKNAPCLSLCVFFLLFSILSKRFSIQLKMTEIMCGMYLRCFSSEGLLNFTRTLQGIRGGPVGYPRDPFLCLFLLLITMVLMNMVLVLLCLFALDSSSTSSRVFQVHLCTECAVAHSDGS